MDVCRTCSVPEPDEERFSGLRVLSVLSGLPPGVGAENVRAVLRLQELLRGQSQAAGLPEDAHRCKSPLHRRDDSFVAVSDLSPLFQLRNGGPAPSGGLPLPWLESQASVLLLTVLQRCSSQYDLHRLLQLLADVDKLLKSNGETAPLPAERAVSTAADVSGPIRGLRPFEPPWYWNLCGRTGPAAIGPAFSFQHLKG